MQSAVQPHSLADVENVRKDFPMLARTLNDNQLIYLDNAGSSLKPQGVLDRITKFYTFEYANTNEQNTLSRGATEAVQEVRSSVRRALGASSPEEIVFLRSATEAVNLVAHAFERSQLQPGDEVVVTEMEHDSNFLPWQIACERSGAVLRIAPIDPSGVLNLTASQNMLSDRTKIAVAHESNVFGTVYPVEEVAAIARRRAIALFVDGAQAAPQPAPDRV